MQKYTHLTLEQRYQISSNLKSNFSISEIARRLGCHKSTISREIKRNTGLRGYRPKQAQSKATERKQTTPIAFLTLHELTSNTHSANIIPLNKSMVGSKYSGGLMYQA